MRLSNDKLISLLLQTSPESKAFKSHSGDLGVLALFLAALLFSVFTGFSQSSAKLSFDKNGEFKIVQFTDTHIELKEKNNLDVYQNIPKVLNTEHPDLVVLTGDIVTEVNPQEGFMKLAAIFEKSRIPWAIVFGNHESENNLSRKDLAAFVAKLPMCLNNDKGTTKGYSNFIYTVAGKDKKTAAVLYFLDSNEYSTLEPNVGGWGWFDHLQVEWYREQSKKLTQTNSGKPFPALAFFHIPLPEYNAAWKNKDIDPVGVRNEDECSPEINTGMFAAMLESGDVMGTFVGHDHINDYIGVHYGIALAYGRVTKTMKEDDDPKAGGRVIVMKEGQRSFETWIREASGKKVRECSYPESFKPKKKKEDK